MSLLHLASLPVDIRALRRWSAMRGLANDEGCALHHLLSETFGKGVLQPFRLLVAKNATHGSIYAYTEMNANNLRQTASECALPDALTVCDLDGLAAKTMPENWKKGRRLAFDLLARPVKRLLKPLGVFPKGAEIDAYLSDAIHKFPSAPSKMERLTRESVYAEWLSERLAGVATIDEARMVHFERRAIWRGGRSLNGPDVIWHGELTIQDPEAFSSRLANGIGRHSAYGYGMLLLRPGR